MEKWVTIWKLTWRELASAHLHTYQHMSHRRADHVCLRDDYTCYLPAVTPDSERTLLQNTGIIWGSPITLLIETPRGRSGWWRTTRGLNTDLANLTLESARSHFDYSKHLSFRYQNLSIDAMTQSYPPGTGIFFPRRSIIGPFVTWMSSRPRVK